MILLIFNIVVDSYASDVLKFYWEDEDPVQLRRGIILQAITYT